MRSISTIFTTLTTPDRFSDDWYGYLLNQVSHCALGLLFVLTLCAGWLGFSGEFPYRWKVFVFVSVVYALKELLLDRWNGFDTIEDFLFVVIYGAGGTLASFFELAGLPVGLVAFDIKATTPFMTMFVLHLSAGCIVRLRNQRRNR